MPFSVMRNRFEIGLDELLLVGRMAALATLVYVEGRAWPLNAAALMIPPLTSADRPKRLRAQRVRSRA